MRKAMCLEVLKDFPQEFELDDYMVKVIIVDRAEQGLIITEEQAKTILKEIKDKRDGRE